MSPEFAHKPPPTEEPRLPLAAGRADADARAADSDEAERRLKLVFESTLDAVLVTNDERCIVDVNEAACALFGRSREDLVGRRPVDLSEPGQDPEGAWDAFRAAGGAQRTWRYRRADGSLIEVLLRATANVLPGRHLVVLRDVTDAREAERILQERRAAGLPAGLEQAAERDRPWRILILEDAPLDAELIEETVRQAGIPFLSRRVDTRDDFVRELERFDPELVLSDFRLPSFDALRALELQLALRPDTPFIIVTGSLSQEAAVECMKAGATDYLVKGQLSRLGPAVLGALQKRRLAEARRRAEQALRASEQRHRSLMEQAIDAILVFDPALRVIEANRRAGTLVGCTHEELVGTSYDELVLPDARQAETGRRPTIFGRGPLRTEDRLLRRRDGTTVPVDISSSVARIGDERLMLLVVRDVSDRKRAEAELLRTQQQLQHVVTSSPAVLYSLRPQADGFHYNWVSENVSRLLGYTPQEAASQQWWSDHLHPDDRERVLAQLQQLYVEDYVAQEYRFRTKAGGYRWLRAELRLLRDADGAPHEAVGSWADISDRKDAELLLAESEKQYRVLFDDNPHSMWVYNEDTLQFLAVNQAAIRSYGYQLDEFLGMTILDIRPREELLASERRSEHLLDIRGPELGTWTHRRKDGSLIQVEVTSSPITFAGRSARLALVNDVTEKKTLEAQLNQAQRMESVGRLAGGVAHDFNNLLGVITGYGELLRRRLQEPKLQKYSEDILQAAERAAGLTRQLLAFSRQQVLQPRTLDVNAVVADIEKMLQRLIGEDVALRTALAKEPGAVRADRGQLEQVLMNLAVNARDAMPKGGQLTIETAAARLDAAYARTHDGVAPGHYVMLAVSDTGHGMTRDVLARVFEPFFTTKGEGKGTGLGLATVYGIVKQSGGHVFAYSEPGQGTAFKVYLPRVDRAPDDDAPAESRPLLRGSETVLLVEDEVWLRELVRECLEDCGYAVLEAPHGEAAVERAEAHAGEIHLLVTDVVMPRLGGRDLAERLLARHPRLRVLYMSGYTDDAVVHHGVLSHEMDFLQKPFTQDALARKVREVLDRP